MSCQLKASSSSSRTKASIATTLVLITQNAKMTALFNFQSALLVLLLFICTAAYCHQLFPAFMDRKKDSPVVGVAWKCARIGERLSPYISVCCVIFAVRLFIGA
ncbi:putative S-adenosylmethionine-dependent methyltransferase [Leptodontidium sp. MPI-SDFR-AT-0119]|nr:putative S-adenosylmethionine-dependent methyltransferase [Leptodontidium sp. MPI-SDFR-AT-0119]